MLRLRVTALPGWHATIDGHPLALQHWAEGAMLEARVPGGRHVIEAHYWPGLFSAGLVAALAVLAGFVGTLTVTVDPPARRRAASDGHNPNNHAASLLTSTFLLSMPYKTTPATRRSTPSRARSWPVRPKPVNANTPEGLAGTGVVLTATCGGGGVV